MPDFPPSVVDKAAWADLQEVDQHGDGLTPFEIEFVESLTKRVKAGAVLTERQRETLAKIREERL